MKKGNTALYLALLIGGGYLIYRLLNPTPATAGATPATGAGLPVQQSLDMALNNIAMGVTRIVQ